MKRVVVLGSTGSIGENTLRVIEAFPDRFKLVGLAAGSNSERIVEQARTFSVPAIALSNPTAVARARAGAPATLRILSGPEGVEEIASLDADIVVSAIVGMAGLQPTLAAIRKGTTVALATKEVLVAAGRLVTDSVTRHGATILPIDSEHSAIFQCLAGQTDATRIQRILLTASGGPFEAHPEIDLNTVTIQEVLNHPRWNMGAKVTVDYATLMNKGLEIMEAHWLFDTNLDQIEVVVHPESIVHSLIDFLDGSMLAQLSVPDMRFAIQYALLYPERLAGGLPKLDLATVGTLTFRSPDINRFPCLGLALEAARTGGTLPAVLNAANEVAVQCFLEGKMAFPGIWKTVETVMNRHKTETKPALDAILEADAWARAATLENLC